MRKPTKLEKEHEQEKANKIRTLSWVSVITLRKLQRGKKTKLTLLLQLRCKNVPDSSMTFAHLKRTSYRSGSFRRVEKEKQRGCTLVPASSKELWPCCPSRGCVALQRCWGLQRFVLSLCTSPQKHSCLQQSFVCHFEIHCV